MKKYLLGLIFLINIISYCFSQNVWIDPGCNNYTNNARIETFYDPILISLPCNSYTINITNSADVHFLSNKEIDLNPGFVVGSFSSGNFDAAIIPVVQNQLNYYSAFLIPGSVDPVSNLPTVAKFSKLELGVSLPYYWVQNEIDNFLNGSRVNGTTLNPYAQDSILIEAVFHGPDNKYYTRYGFYYESCNYVPNSEFNNPADSMSCLVDYPGYVIGSPTSLCYSAHRDNSWPFRIRFAPPVAGIWSVTTSVYLPYLYGNTPQATFNGNFNVTDNTNGGDIVKGNNWHLKYEDGGSFFPIGQNIWPSNSWGPSPYPCCGLIPGEWIRADPPSFVQCRADIDDLAANKGNYVRLRASDSWGFLIDWDDANDYEQAPGDYESRQYAAWELDKTVMVCEKDNVKLQPVLFEDQHFSYSFGASPQGLSWANGGNTYYNLLHKMYPTETPDQLLYTFFSDPTAMYYVQRYLFYINARWGYSPSISTWELWNEADQLGNYATKTYMYSSGDGAITATDFQNQLATWQKDIMKYLRNMTGNPSMPTFFPVHLITCGYAGEPAFYDDAWNQYDIFETHQYAGSPPENVNRANAAQDFADINSNAFLFGELGALNNYDACQDISFHDACWATAVISSGAGLYWDDWQQTGGITHRANFSSLNSFFSQFDFEGNIFLQFPIYYEDNTNHLEYYYIVNNGADIDRTDDYHASNPPPGTDDISTEIGWIHNLTNSYENNSYSSSCAGSCIASLGPYTESSSASNLSPGNVEFYGLNAWTDYDIKFFDTYSNSYFTYSNQTASWLGNLSLSVNFGTVEGDPYEPDYAYYISESPGHRYHPSSQVLPNDTVYIPMDSLIFPGAIKDYHKGLFSWNFGNGITSHSTYPKFIYYNEGNYLVTVDYSDTISRINEHIEKTYVVLKRPVSIESYNSSFIVEPNPGTGIFTIIVENNMVIDELEVMDASGKIYLNETSPKENTFNITSLASGVYFIKILSNGLLYYRKVVKY